MCIGIMATCLYNAMAGFLRAIGNSVIPLVALIIASITNVILDIFFVLVLGMGVPGVAIATALMPPLCTCGFSIANGHWSMLAGAAFLFIINTFFIFLSSTIVLMILEVPQVNE